MTSEGVSEESWAILDQLEEQATQSGPYVSKQDHSDSQLSLSYTLRLIYSAGYE